MKITQHLVVLLVMVLVPISNCTHTLSMEAALGIIFDVEIFIYAKTEKKVFRLSAVLMTDPFLLTSR